MITTIGHGYFTTIQDEGRWGYQAFGLPVAGAMDRYAYRLANLLVGNSVNAAGLEMTCYGAAFRFDEERLVALCGADMQAKLNGQPVANWSSFWVPKYGELTLEAAVTGYRAYLAVRGGLAVPAVLGSRSTYTRAQLGGYRGRALQLGDVLRVSTNSATAARPQVLPPVFIPEYSAEPVLRVLLGPQDTLFSAEAIHNFFANSYTVTEQADRAGYQLKGGKIITSSKAADIVSDAVGLGAIQIPANGMPFLVTADHQTTRGFPKLGYIIRVDMGKLAQARPGDNVRFCRVTEAEAVEALRQEQQAYRALQEN